MYETSEKHVILLQQATRFGFVYLAVVFDPKEFYADTPTGYINNIGTAQKQDGGSNGCISNYMAIT